MSSKPLTVFIASTSSDLREHRQVVARTLEGLSMLPLRMDSLGASPGTPVDECVAHASRADAVVVIVGQRYGWIPSIREGGDGQRSITWLEMAAAERAGKPIFSFIVDDDVLTANGREQDRLLDAASAEEAAAIWQAVQNLRRFKSALATRIFARFITPADLAKEVVLSLVRHFGLEGRLGPAGGAPGAPAPHAPTGSGGVTVINTDTTIGTQIVAEQVDGLRLEARIDRLLDGLL
jgi:hypothetical protein